MSLKPQFNDTWFSIEKWKEICVQSHLLLELGILN